MVSITAESLWYLQSLCAWSLLFCFYPFLGLCLVLSSRIKHNAFIRGWLLPSPSLAGSQTWASSTTRGQRLTFGDSLYYPHSMGREQGWDHLRTTQRFGVFWFISPSCPSQSLDNLLYREDFSRSTHEVGMTWVHTG